MLSCSPVLNYQMFCNQMAVKQIERQFWAHIIMHMRNMRIIAIIMLLTKVLSTAIRSFVQTMCGLYGNGYDLSIAFRE